MNETEAKVIKKLYFSFRYYPNVYGFIDPISFDHFGNDYTSIQFYFKIFIGSLTVLPNCGRNFLIR